MGYAASGDNTIAASTADSLLIQVPGSGGTTLRASRVILLTGLSAGSTTFTLKYIAIGGTASFRDRTIAAIRF